MKDFNEYQSIESVNLKKSAYYLYFFVFHMPENTKAYICVL